MKVLKLKAKIYQWTGIYLAHLEENEYLQSKEFWKSFIKIIKNKKNDMSPSLVQGLLIGLWQSKHGFYREWKRLRK